MILDDVDRGDRGTLERFGFDAERFESCAPGSPRASCRPRRTSSTGVVEPPAERRPRAAARRRARRSGEAARAAGLDALAAGRVAQVVLAGGMATRFGGVVKGVVEALDGRSFLAWKLGETERLGEALGVEIPVALMTSFATDDETRAHVAALGRPGAALVLPVRLAAAHRDG